MKKLDLHNTNSIEAHLMMKTFLIESYQTRQKKVLIVHGYGHLILKKTLYNLTKELDFIEKLEDAPYQIGAGGATIITLKGKHD